ncbi:hypothetical protein HPP92_013064 [Vanilla planifolia]|uniref:Beta-ketoacyl-[acyl-carrier-protein] synthase III N-terminal domain-containing protein n=1 Tax=Vanilla planifolia TaxID=51239 RepID=A0A835QXE6_VANPL|nr:hypothetical protein HPP92_013064 [Vanilla planifolia]
MPPLDLPLISFPTSPEIAIRCRQSSLRSFTDWDGSDGWACIPALPVHPAEDYAAGCARLCAAVEGGVKDHVLGATSSAKPRLPRLVGMGSKLVGCGSAVPKFNISNDDLAQIVETSDEWISVRTGIRNRRVLSGDENLNGLALKAASGALEMSSVLADDVDLLILCTSTPDDLFGGGGQIQRDLGCKNAWTFDITAACSGFLIGLITATRFIKGGGYHNILVVGADALSRHVDWTDRGTCILFGDAAGAVLVQEVKFLQIFA